MTQASIYVENNFTKGLVTEASGINFPKDACTTTFDCIHNVIGSVKRRQGFEYEINNSEKSIDRSDGVVVSYLWRDVAGDGNISLVVLQVKDHLYFYDGSTTDPLSGHPITDNIDLTDFSPIGAPTPETQECQFTAGHGKLFVVHPYLEPFAVEYDTNLQTFTSTQIDIQIRDFEGLVDNMDVDERPTVGMGGVTIEHHYNLLNQGWNATNLAAWDAARTDLPSNADVMWRFKNSSDAFDTATIVNVIQGNSPASKGHYILNAFNQERDVASGLSIADVSSGYQRPSAISFFSGRLFYAGVNYVGFNSKIYFSPVIERDSQFGQCYQVNDPTSEATFDLLASDGGVIVIQEAGTILKLIPVPGGLVIFASNGVWVITGSTGLGFTANDYTVAKVSAVSSLTSTSFVDVAGVPVWWNLEGIYRLEATGQGFQVNSISHTIIKTFYDTIPPSEKRNARGYYNPITSVVQWLFRSTEAGDLNTYYEYDRILNLNVLTGSFYVWTIPSSDIKMHGMVVLENRGGEVALENVTNNALATITNNALETIQVWTIGNSIVIPSFKYVISHLDGTHKFTFAEERETTYLDWVLFGDSTDYTSYIIGGYKIAGDIMRDFQSNYVTFYSDNASKYTVQGLWDFSNTINTKRWSTSQTIDATANTNFDLNKHRRKIRGQGKALQIKISSVSGQPFEVKGWGVFVTVNPTP